jgi:hypothetical protein
MLRKLTKVIAASIFFLLISCVSAPNEVPSVNLKATYYQVHQSVVTLFPLSEDLGVVDLLNEDPTMNVEFVIIDIDHNTLVICGDVDMTTEPKKGCGAFVFEDVLTQTRADWKQHQPYTGADVPYDDVKENIEAAFKRNAA